MSTINRVKMTQQGPELSEVVQGYWRLNDWKMSPQARLTFMKQHIELGVTSVDHADIYGGYQCETLFGEALKLEPSLREKMQIVSKCGIHLLRASSPERKINHYETSEKHILHSVENSLSRLGIECLDVLLIHRPDCLMDADEVAGAFEKLQVSGKVKHFGVSNFTPSQFTLLQSRLDKPLVTNQVEINPLHFDVIEDGTLDLMQQLRVRPMAWSSLAGGDIFTSYSDQAVRVRATLNEIAQELDTDIVLVIYAFANQLPSNPLCIVGSGKIERVQSAVDALSLTLSREQWYRIWVASKGHGVA